MHLTRVICLVLVLVTILVYLPVRQYQFVVFDDPQYVTENRVVRAGLSLTGVKWAFSSMHAANWHPITWLSHMLDVELFGLQSGAHHLVNVLSHAANAVLVFLLLMKLTGHRWPAATVAGLFALHPLHVESVAWVAERKDVLSAFFGLLTLLAYVRFAKNAGNTLQATLVGSVSKAKFSKRICSAEYAGALVFFALALMSKPMLVTLPIVMLLLDYWPLRRHRFSRQELQAERLQPVIGAHRGSSGASLILEKAPFFLMAGAVGIVTVIAQRAEAIVALDVYPLLLRIANAVAAYGTYLAKTVWPVNLAVIYPLQKKICWEQLLGAGGVLATISWFAWRTRRTRPYLIVGWLWFVVMLLPVIGIVQVGGQAMADRYTYLPLLGVFIMAGYGGAELAARLRINRLSVGLSTATALALCAGVTRHQLQFWRDSETLLTRALAVTRSNELAHINLGTWLQEQGRLAEALDHYKAALQIQPARPHTHNNIAIVLDLMGQDDAAQAHYQLALRLCSNAPITHLNYGSFLLKRGRIDEAIQHYTIAQQLAPDDPRPSVLLGKAAIVLGRPSEAEAHFRHALQVDKDDVQALALLARVLASHERTDAAKATEAIELAERANAIVAGQDVFVLDTLACAYANAGRFDHAQRILLRAIELATATGATNAVHSMQQRLELFRAGKPWREGHADLPPQSGGS